MAERSEALASEAREACRVFGRRKFLGQTNFFSRDLQKIFFCSYALALIRHPQGRGTLVPHYQGREHLWPSSIAVKPLGSGVLLLLVVRNEGGVPLP